MQHGKNDNAAACSAVIFPAASHKPPTLSEHLLNELRGSEMP